MSRNSRVRGQAHIAPRERAFRNRVQQHVAAGPAGVHFAIHVQLARIEIQVRQLPRQAVMAAALPTNSPSRLLPLPCRPACTRRCQIARSFRSNRCATETRTAALPRPRRRRAAGASPAPSLVCLVASATPARARAAGANSRRIPCRRLSVGRNKRSSSWSEACAADQAHRLRPSREIEAVVRLDRDRPHAPAQVFHLHFAVFDVHARRGNSQRRRDARQIQLAHCAPRNRPTTPPPHRLSSHIASCRPSRPGGIRPTAPARSALSSRRRARFQIFRAQQPRADLHGKIARLRVIARFDGRAMPVVERHLRRRHRDLAIPNCDADGIEPRRALIRKFQRRVGDGKLTAQPTGAGKFNAAVHLPST